MAEGVEAKAIEPDPELASLDNSIFKALENKDLNTSNKKIDYKLDPEKEKPLDSASIKNKFKEQGIPSNLIDFSYNLFQALKKVESGAEKDPYSALGDTIDGKNSAHKGQNAFGAYQFMPKTYAALSNQYFNKILNPNSPENQDLLAIYNFTDILKRTPLNLLTDKNLLIDNIAKGWYGTGKSQASGNKDTWKTYANKMRKILKIDTVNYTKETYKSNVQTQTSNLREQITPTEKNEIAKRKEIIGSVGTVLAILAPHRTEHLAADVLKILEPLKQKELNALKDYQDKTAEIDSIRDTVTKYFSKINEALTCKTSGELQKSYDILNTLSQLDIASTQKEVINAMKENLHIIIYQQKIIEEQNNILRNPTYNIDLVQYKDIASTQLEFSKASEYKDDWKTYLFGLFKELNTERKEENLQSTKNHHLRTMSVLSKAADSIIYLEDFKRTNSSNETEVKANTATEINKLSSDLFSSAYEGWFIDTAIPKQEDFTNILTAFVNKKRAQRNLVCADRNYTASKNELGTLNQMFDTNVKELTKGYTESELRSFEERKYLFRKDKNTGEKINQAAIDKIKKDLKKPEGTLDEKSKEQSSDLVNNYETGHTNAIMAEISKAKAEYLSNTSENSYDKMDALSKEYLEAQSKGNMKEWWGNLSGGMKILAIGGLLYGAIKSPKLFVGLGAGVFGAMALTKATSVGDLMDKVVNMGSNGLESFATKLGINDHARWNDFEGREGIQVPNTEEEMSLNIIEHLKTEDLKTALTGFSVGQLESLKTIQTNEDVPSSIKDLFKKGKSERIFPAEINEVNLCKALYKILRMRAMRKSDTTGIDGNTVLDGFNALVDDIENRKEGKKSTFHISQWISTEISQHADYNILGDKLIALGINGSSLAAHWVGGVLKDGWEIVKKAGNAVVDGVQYELKVGEGEDAEYFWEVDPKVLENKDALGKLITRLKNFPNSNLAVQFDKYVFENADDMLDYLGLFSADVWNTKYEDKVEKQLNKPEQLRYKKLVEEFQYILHPLDKAIGFAEEDFDIFSLPSLNGDHGNFQENRAFGLLEKAQNGIHWELFQMVKQGLTENSNEIKNYKKEVQAKVMQTILTLVKGEQSWAADMMDWLTDNKYSAEKAKKLVAAFKNADTLDKQYDLLEEYEDLWLHSSIIFDLVNITDETNPIVLNQINTIGLPTKQITEDVQEFAKQLAASMENGRKDRIKSEAKTFGNTKIDLYGQDESVGGGQFFGQAVFLYQEFLSTAQDANSGPYEEYQQYLEKNIAAELHGTGIIETPTRLDIKQLRRELKYFGENWRDEPRINVRSSQTTTGTLRGGAYSANTPEFGQVEVPGDTSNDHHITILSSFKDLKLQTLDSTKTLIEQKEASKEAITLLNKEIKNLETKLVADKNKKTSNKKLQKTEKQLKELNTKLTEIQEIDQNIEQVETNNLKDLFIPAFMNSIDFDADTFGTDQIFLDSTLKEKGTELFEEAFKNTDAITLMNAITQVGVPKEIESKSEIEEFIENVAKKLDAKKNTLDTTTELEARTLVIQQELSKNIEEQWNGRTLENNASIMHDSEYHNEQIQELAKQLAKSGAGIIEIQDFIEDSSKNLAIGKSTANLRWEQFTTEITKEFPTGVQKEAKTAPQKVTPVPPKQKVTSSTPKKTPQKTVAQSPANTVDITKLNTQLKANPDSIRQDLINKINTADKASTTRKEMIKTLGKLDSNALENFLDENNEAQKAIWNLITKFDTKNNTYTIESLPNIKTVKINGKEKKINALSTYLGFKNLKKHFNTLFFQNGKIKSTYILKLKKYYNSNTKKVINQTLTIKDQAHFYNKLGFVPGTKFNFEASKKITTPKIPQSKEANSTKAALAGAAAKNVKNLEL